MSHNYLSNVTVRGSDLFHNRWDVVHRACKVAGCYENIGLMVKAVQKLCRENLIWLWEGRIELHWEEDGTPSPRMVEEGKTAHG